jgi:prepilin-type N-terminal cleavage/methylation domain-containing protein
MKGFSLIETLLAVFIFSTAMLGAAFMTMQSLKMTRESLQYSQKLTQVKEVSANANS